jgi:hypothetical protein
MDDLLDLYRDQISMAFVHEQERSRSEEAGHHSERRRENNGRSGKQNRKGRFNPPLRQRSGLVCFFQRVASERYGHFGQ